MVSSKMAASLWKSCATLNVKFRCLSASVTGRRWLLSAAYTDTRLWEEKPKDPQNLALLANVMDRTYDKNLPVSSLSVARFVENISSREEVDQAEYYLYKFRHSPNCWYLRDWTIHDWIRKCLKYKAREKALHTLKNKVQFGIFPNDFTFNLILDSYIKDGNFKNAFSVVEEVMLQEAFDRPSTQFLSLYALAGFLAARPELTVSEERSLGASLLLCGLKQENTTGLSARLLGNAFLGKVETLQGLHAVFKGMPLLWTPGYTDRALAVMEAVPAGDGDVKLNGDALDVVNRILQEVAAGEGGDAEGEREKKLDYLSRFKDLCQRLESQGRVDSAPFLTSVTSLVQQNLAAAEEPDLLWYREQMRVWASERDQLIQRERETRAERERVKLNAE